MIAWVATGSFILAFVTLRYWNAQKDWKWLCRVGLHRWVVIRMYTYDNHCRCYRCHAESMR